MTAALRDLIAQALHEAEDGPTCPYAVKHQETYEPLADAVLALLGDRLPPEGFSITETSPVYDVIDRRLMRREVIRADGPWIDWGGKLGGGQGGPANGDR